MFSKIIRRTHMYLALFLTPWMLMYALSTIVMNHHQFFQSLYGGNQPKYEIEKELDYKKTFPSDAEPDWVAAQILEDVALEGAYRVRGSLEKGHITIDRHDALTPRRITYTPGKEKIVIEKQPFRTTNFLDRMHTRRGFNQPYLKDDIWGFSVDLAITAMIFWVASGLWMWWEMKPTRRWGAISALLGIALFALFLFTI